LINLHPVPNAVKIRIKFEISISAINFEANDDKTVSSAYNVTEQDIR